MPASRAIASLADSVRAPRAPRGVLAWVAACAGLAVAAACGGSDLLLPSDNAAASITIAAGDGQSAAAGATLPDSVAVRVTDANGRPVAGQRVAFVVTAGAGAAAPDTALTDAQGRAAAHWTLGGSAGAQTLEARVVGASAALAAHFAATATAGTPARLALVSGDKQTAAAGSALPDSLVVRATDADGNPAPGAHVVWTLSGGGSVNATNTTTGADGRAAVQRVLGSRIGEARTVATAAGLAGSPITFSASATVGGASALAVVRQPSASAQQRTPFSRQPQVQLTDAFGNAVRQAGIAISAELPSDAGGVLDGQLTASTDASGLATFIDLALHGAATSYTLRFSNAGSAIAPAVSDPIALSPGPVSGSRSSVTVNPSSIPAAGTSTVTVAARDEFDNPIAGVSASASSSGASATIAPASAPTNASGAATFSFSATKVGSYTITAKVGGIAVATPATVTVTKAPSTTTITGVTESRNFLLRLVRVSFTVMSATAQTPTGKVAVTDGPDSCTADVASGFCSFVPSVRGTTTITATYSGDDTFAPSSGKTTFDVQ
ncbi:MAG TPA: Ig-like domain-containing protein [Gemmatimonadales bacterium]|nr:Ig-like domain-containing protein [Gemmatimonadales bacterium]